MKLKTIILTTIISSSLVSKSQTLNDIWNTAKNAAVTNSTTIIDAAKSNSTTVIEKAESVISGHNTTSAPALTNEEVINGLKEALSVGTNNSSGMASKADGFLKNPAIFIPWPAEAKDMREKLIKMGMQKKVTEFETALNRAAEEAAKKSAPVFKDAITGMSIGDGFAILNGGDTAATHYLREKTFTPLKEKFMPTVKEAIAKVKVTSYWTPLATAYNKLPGVKKQNPNLNDYVCTKAINGLMVLIKDEEAKIRKDPMAQVTDLLKKVFGKK
ncbi:MAG: DUF4197 domain-containing protein [Bacteroidetes bacterium]|nr:DUF4197 domain-containing protein [Bacteroidota bacterium]